MKPIQKINKKFIRSKNNVKDRYWANSLYAIEEEYVPTSLLEQVEQADMQNAQQQDNNNNENNNENNNGNNNENNNGNNNGNSSNNLTL